ncbi:hypothetical protein PROFUN_04828 [Planoprotostelium fungivorum]|uniref:Uncharacterized protein n=1 Tax=Planoprotostelium fungivorum TaxID=1890364 RepID=A0A2P6NSZ3_9EUKA|nr:hypothetical protein PROFUN_04828 [Planoprotostelium fungivorum]
MDLIRIVSNNRTDMKDRYFSDLLEQSEKVQLDKTPKKKDTPVTKK